MNTVNSVAPQPIPCGSKNGRITNPPKKYSYTVWVTCQHCGQKSQKRKKGKKTAKFCNLSCSSIHNMGKPEARKHLSNIHLKKRKTSVCLECKTLISYTPSHPKRFCNTSCSAIHRNKNPKVRLNLSQKMKAVWATKAHPRKGAKCQKSSNRMKKNNPMRNPDTVEKMRKSLQGRTFLSRGGNGKLTKPQLLLHHLSGYPMEHVIPIGNRAPQSEKSPPNHYKVDLAIPHVKIAIEIDGESHKTKLWRFLDKRKTRILNHLGWSVLRFWNQQVTENPSQTFRTIQRFTTSKLRRTTTTLQRAY